MPWVFGARVRAGIGRRPAGALAAAGRGRRGSARFGRAARFGPRLEHAFRAARVRRGATAFAAAGFEVLPIAARALRRADVRSPRRPTARRTLAYSGDTGPTPRLAELARDADLFLCEATLADPEPAERGHLTADEARDAFRASGAQRLLVIHRPEELPLDAELELAHDGLSLEV